MEAFYNKWTGHGMTTSENPRFTRSGTYNDQFDLMAENNKAWEVQLEYYLERQPESMPPSIRDILLQKEMVH